MVSTQLCKYGTLRRNQNIKQKYKKKGKDAFWRKDPRCIQYLNNYEVYNSWQRKEWQGKVYYFTTGLQQEICWSNSWVNKNWPRHLSRRFFCVTGSGRPSNSYPFFYSLAFLSAYFPQFRCHLCQHTNKHHNAHCIATLRNPRLTCIMERNDPLLWSEDMKMTRTWHAPWGNLRLELRKEKINLEIGWGKIWLL